MTDVQISATDLAASTNIAPLITTALSGLGAGDRVTFERQPGIDRYPWSGKVQPPAGVALEGSPVTITDATPTMIEPAGAGCTIRGVDVEANSNISVAVVRLGDGIDDTTITRLEVSNSGDVEANAIIIDDADNTLTEYCTSHRVKRLVWIRGAATGTKVHHNTGTEFGAAAFEMGSTGLCHDTDLFHNKWHKHAADADAGHMIAITAHSSGQLHTNLRIVDNEAYGQPGVANVRDVANGASGDMIAVRGVDGFAVVGNHVKDSGEIGITAVRGSRNGVLADNLVEGTDLSGIAVGGFGANNTPVSNIAMSRNQIRNYGRDLQEAYTARPDIISGVLLGLAEGPGVTMDHMSISNDGTGGYGIYADTGAICYLDRASAIAGPWGHTHAEDGAILTAA